MDTIFVSVVSREHDFVECAEAHAALQILLCKQTASKMTPTRDKNIVSAKAQWILRGASYLALFDLAVVVMTGGVSLIGPVTPIGFAACMLVALGLVAFEGFRRNERFYAYVGLLLLLLPLLSFSRLSSARRRTLVLLLRAFRRFRWGHRSSQPVSKARHRSRERLAIGARDRACALYLSRRSPAILGTVALARPCERVVVERSRD